MRSHKVTQAKVQHVCKGEKIPYDSPKWLNRVNIFEGFVILLDVCLVKYTTTLMDIYNKYFPNYFKVITVFVYMLTLK